MTGADLVACVVVQGLVNGLRARAHVPDADGDAEGGGVGGGYGDRRPARAARAAVALAGGVGQHRLALMVLGMFGGEGAAHSGPSPTPPGSTTPRGRIVRMMMSGYFPGAALSQVWRTSGGGRAVPRLLEDDTPEGAVRCARWLLHASR